MKSTVQAQIALILVANLSLGMAAAPAVGVVSAWGSFTIDHSSITGNATLFEGNEVETGRASSRLQLSTGARVQLAAESRGIVYRDRLVLEKGSSRFEAGNYQVEALSLKIRPESEGAAQVTVRQPGMVRVAALTGPVRVTAANGVLLAKLQAGHTVDFTPDASGPAAPALVTGCLETGSGKYLLTDEVSLVRFEITGAGVDKEVGHRVQIAGTVTPVPESMSRIHSTAVKELSKKCSTRIKGAAAAGVGAAGAAGAAGAGGAASGGAIGAIGSAIASHAVIAGVIVAGAAAGAAVAVVKKEDKSPSISPSGR
ncbi:MAG TPA: hypothetical protein VL285_14470 [Bryobacteraceae bacterium]|nr:hypothetical protein [Bryobacteraceae bacterium]